MAILVHIADERNSAGIAKSGLKPGRPSGVVYFMPVLLSHFVSHQWVRELRRSGARVMVGVYFRLSVDEVVWAGKYNEKHQRLALGKAIQQLDQLADPLGFELFIERKIKASEIVKIRHLPQKIGWRYKPHAHGVKPCACPVCSRGVYGSQRIRELSEPPSPKTPLAVFCQRILESNEPEVLSEALWAFRGRRRRSDPAFLGRLLHLNHPDVLEDLAVALAGFRHKNTRPLLISLCGHASPAVREAAAESAFEIYRQDARSLLGAVAEDPVVSKFLADKEGALAGTDPVVAIPPAAQAAQ